MAIELISVELFESFGVVFTVVGEAIDSEFRGLILGVALVDE